MEKIIRPVFIPTKRKPFFRKVNVNFESPGLDSFENKQSSILAMHEEFLKKYPERKILEISTKSLQDEGVQLSAFNLMKYEASLQRKISVENIYQASKKFSHGGPYIDLLFVTPKEAKKDERIRSSGKVTSYIYHRERFPIKPRYLFFDYIYLSALYENLRTAHGIDKYDAFTDIEFDPATGTNCQAATVARIKGMLMANLDVEAILKEIEKTKKHPPLKNFKKKEIICEFPPCIQRNVKKQFYND